MTANYIALAEQLYLPHEEDSPNATIARYLEVLNNGLSGTAKQKKKVVIVGAGISGMLSALLLADYGLDVEIIEANADRVGGRIKTFRNSDGKKYFFDNKQYGEAGAMRFPSIHPLLMSYIEKYGLEEKKQQFFLVDVNNPDSANPNKVGNTLLRTNSFEQRRNQYEQNKLDTNQRFFTEQQQVPTLSAGQLLDQAFDPVRDYYSYKEVITTDEGVRQEVRYNKPYEQWIQGWAKVIEDFDSYSLERFLKEKAGLDQSSIQLIGTLENLTSRMPLSFIHSFLGRSDINPKNVYYELRGGSYQLTQVLAEKIAKHPNICLRKDRRMTHLHFHDEQLMNQQTGDFKCHAEDSAGKRVSIRTVGENDDQQDPITGDLAIVTIPFSSLRFVRTFPDFSYQKRRAIMELHYDAATKVLLEFSKRWWEFTEQQWRDELKLLLDEQKISEQQYQDYLNELTVPLEQGGYPAMHAFGGGSMTDNPNRGMYYPSHKVEGSEEGVILASYTWADDARRWDSMNDQDRYMFALRGLAAMHGEKIRPFALYHNKQLTGASNTELGAATQSWARSPYAFGEAAVFQPYQLTDLHPNIPTPEGPIHFAGDHTSLKHAWIEGSLESAIRVALEIQQTVEQ